MTRPNRPRPLLFTALILVLSLVTAACAGDDEAAADPSVAISSPMMAATVKSPVTFEMTANDFTIEPAGSAREGAGHFHLMIDVPCITPGENIPADDSHVHYGDASTTAELELEPGEHTVCLQAGDGLHIALDLTDTVTFTVSE